MMKSDDPIKQYEPLWGHWIIESLIGEGSYGRVYRAVRTDQGGRYYSAVKHISIPKSQREIDDARRMGMSTADMYRYFDRTVTRILREIGIMHELRGNTNIVAYEDHEILHNDGETKWEVFIRMELLEPLPAYLERQALSPADVCRLGMELCSALEICTRRGIIHRDVKEGNVFVTRDGTFKLGDFGIARELSEQSRSGMSFSGTPSYLAPEVYKREKYDATVDIYSLGILLYKLLNNARYPFYPPYPAPIAMENAEEAFSRRLKGEQIPAPANGGRKLQATVLKACAYRPQSRFQTAEQLRTALQTASASAQTAPMRLPVAGERTGGRTNSRRSVELPDTEATVALTHQEQQRAAAEAQRQLEQKHLQEEKEQARRQREAERIAVEKHKAEQRQRQEAEKAAVARQKAAQREEAAQRKAAEKQKREEERAAEKAETARQRAEARAKKDAEKQRRSAERAVAQRKSNGLISEKSDIAQECDKRRGRMNKWDMKAIIVALTVVLVALVILIVILLPKVRRMNTESQQVITSVEPMSVPISAEIVQADYEYEKTDAGITIKKYIGNAAEVNIPDNVDGTPVVSIGESAFLSCRELISVTIPAGTKHIGTRAFSECWSLKNVDIPNSVTDIGARAFTYCILLENITIPDSVNSIGEGAFEGCSTMKSVTIPRSVISIGNYAFFKCSSLTSIMLPYGLTSICQGTFSKCYALESITIPSSVTSVGDWSFAQCMKLSKASIPEGVTYIGANAFYKCVELQNIAIPSSVEIIGDSAFSHCSALSSISIPAGMQSIEPNIFSCCESLKEITIPSGVTIIKQNAFGNCTALTSITIPKSVKIITEHVFNNIPKLTIYCEKESATAKYAQNHKINTVYIAVEEMNQMQQLLTYNDMIAAEAKRLYEYTEGNGAIAITEYIGDETEVEIPASIDGVAVKEIGENSFRDCSTLTSIVIPDGVSSIGASVFWGCDMLTSIVIPNSVASVGDYAFYHCSALKRITVSDSVTSIGYYTFGYCTSLESIVMSDSVARIDAGAFYGCTTLTDLLIPRSVSCIDADAFKNAINLTIHCPLGSYAETYAKESNIPYITY